MRCQNCHSTRIVVNRYTGEVTCLDCGSVIDEKVIDQGQEWRAYDDLQRKKRARAEPSPSLGGTPCFDTRDFRGRAIPLERLSNFRRMVRARLDPYADRSYREMNAEIERIVSCLRLPKYIKEEALSLFLKARGRGLLKGRSYAGFASACVLAACKKSDVICDLAELVSVSKASRKTILRNYRDLRAHGVIDRIRPLKPTSYVAKLRSELGLSMEIENLARKITRKIEESRLLQSKMPKGVAASALYISSIILGRDVRQSDISSISGIASPTLRKNMKLIMSKIDIEVMV